MKLPQPKYHSYSIYRTCDSPRVDVIDIKQDCLGLFNTDLCIEDWVDILPDFDNFPCVGHMPIRDVKAKLLVLLERCSWNGSSIKRAVDDIDKMIFDAEIRKFVLNLSAKKIQVAWRIYLTDPSFVMCRTRLMREFSEMSDEIRGT